MQTTNIVQSVILTLFTMMSLKCKAIGVAKNMLNVDIQMAMFMFRSKLNCFQNKCNLMIVWPLPLSESDPPKPDLGVNLRAHKS